MRYYRLCQDSFTRRYADYGYVTSQLTKQDRVYDSVGAEFLMALTRAPQLFDAILIKASSPFENPPMEQISADLAIFLADLEDGNYIVSGETVGELNAREPRFTYAMENTKCSVYNILQNREDNRIPDTQGFLSKLLHDNPQIFNCQIELNNQCNERCIHCYIPHEEKNKRLNIETILDVLQQLHNMGTLSLTLSGGEAFMHPNFEKILRLARELDFSIGILSNLTLLKQKHIRLLQEINPSIVQTSLYSMNATEHDAITKLPGSHAKTLAALELLIAADIPVQISCPVMKTNRQSYKAVLEWAQAHRCKAQTDFIMMAKTNFTTDNLNERLSLEETNELMKDILAVDIDYGELILTPISPMPVEEIMKQPVCGVGIDSICLAANGTFYPCSGWQSYAVGNAKTQRIADIWRNSPKLNYLRTINKGSFPGCISCENKDYCSMCMVRNYNESGGDMFKINTHFCNVAHLNRENVETHKENLGIPS